MKNYPIVRPPLKIPSPHSHMSIYQRHSCFREVRITKGTIAESKKSPPYFQAIFQYAKHNLLLPHLPRTRHPQIR